MNHDTNFLVEASADPKVVPKRLAFVKKNVAARVEWPHAEELVMSFPHLVVREVISFQAVAIILAILSLLINAPLEDVANPEHTPNPAKAPWYFLGLQELLHYFPPVVAGVLIPTLVVIALIVIPYVEINIKREGLWKTNRRRSFIVLTASTAAIALAMVALHCLAIAIPTLLLYGTTLIPYFSDKESGLAGWLGRKSLAEWIMTWFVTLAATLTGIGILFRGPGWSWSWPWVHGVY